MTDPAYCERGELPLATCVHGMPPAPPPEVKAPAARKRATSPRATPSARTGSAASTGGAGVTVRRVGTNRTPQKAFRPQILASLHARGGQAETEQVLGDVEERMGSQLREGDLEAVERDEPRWRRAVRRERKAMVDEGLLLPLQQPGVWELSPEGSAQAETLFAD